MATKTTKKLLSLEGLKKKYSRGYAMYLALSKHGWETDVDTAVYTKSVIHVPCGKEVASPYVIPVLPFCPHCGGKTEGQTREEESQDALLRAKESLDQLEDAWRAANKVK